MRDVMLGSPSVDNPLEWSKAPAWAKYRAQDFDGRWYWFNREPKFGYKSWLLRGVFSEFIAQGYTNVYWRGTLEAKPTEEK